MKIERAALPCNCSNEYILQCTVFCDLKFPGKIIESILNKMKSLPKKSVTLVSNETLGLPLEECHNFCSLSDSCIPG